MNISISLPAQLIGSFGFLGASLLAFAKICLGC
jgi:hypothetical protein